MKYFLLFLFIPFSSLFSNPYTSEQYDLYNENSDKYVFVSVRSLSKIPKIIFFLIGDKTSKEIGAWITSSENFYSHPVEDMEGLIQSSNHLNYELAKIIFPDYVVSDDKYQLIELN